MMMGILVKPGYFGALCLPSMALKKELVSLSSLSDYLRVWSVSVAAAPGLATFPAC